MALINTTTTGVLGSTFFGDGTGPLTVQQNGVTLGVYGNIPAFSAYSSANQLPSSGVSTKVIFGTESYDTNSNYDPSLGRFTPTVAGYYQLNASVSMSADTSISSARIYITKNGSGQHVPMSEHTALSGNGYYTPIVSALVYANGTTDYFEVYGFVEGTGTNRYFFSSSAGLHSTVFQGILIKAA